MSEIGEGSVTDWLRRATEDLQVAELLLPHGLSNAVGFHCKQVAEKALKALLVARGIPPRKTHELDLLVAACRAQGWDLPADLDDAADTLSPYALVSRHPGWGEVDDEHAEQALVLARRVILEVQRRLGGADRNGT